MRIKNKIRYESLLQRIYSKTRDIKHQCNEIFRGYPVRVRTQKAIDYYEIGASNLKQDGNIVMSDNHKIRHHANESAFNQQYLRTGDIVIPYRSSRLSMGLFLEPKLYPLIPNPGLIVLRTGSKEKGRYLFTCLQQPFIKSYLESTISKSNGGAILDMDELRTLMLPLATSKILTEMMEIEKYRYLLNRLSKLHSKFDQMTLLLSSKVITEEYESTDQIFLKDIEEQIGKLERLLSSLDVFPIHSSATDLLQSNFAACIEDN